MISGIEKTLRLYSLLAYSLLDSMIANVIPLECRSHHRRSLNPNEYLRSTEHSGAGVSALRAESQFFISEESLRQAVQALEEKKSGLDRNLQIQLEVALQALDNGYSLSEIVAQATAQVERFILTHFLGLSNGNKARTANILGLDAKVFCRKLHKYGIQTYSSSQMTFHPC
jgi:DNA-binding protein Fis